MRDAIPSVYLVGRTQLDHVGVNEYFLDIGKPAWEPDVEISDGENLVEMAGRMCYRSWEPWNPEKPLATNPNVKKVRKGNKKYLGNILNHGHGSILEHVNMTFIARDVSRVFTHQLVRHRAGMAYAQESFHYVRLDNISMWLPDDLKRNRKAKEIFYRIIETLEDAQLDLADAFDIENIKDFHIKKQLTTLFRRLAPTGIATSIMFTANIRALRHMIEMRTPIHNDIELCLVFDMIAQICKAEYPNFFQDMERIEDDPHG